MPKKFQEIDNNIEKVPVKNEFVDFPQKDVKIVGKYYDDENENEIEEHEKFNDFDNDGEEGEEIYIPSYFKKSSDCKSKSRKKLLNVTIGSDFEVFLYDKKLNEVINAKPFVKGSKKSPYNFDKSNPFWTTSLDNVLAEGNIPPVDNINDFDTNIAITLKYIKDSLPPNIILLSIPAWYMKQSALKTKEAKTFGCEASYNAYTGYENPRPECHTNLRTSAFHIHIKYDDMDFDTSCELIKVLDLYLGIPSILLEPKNDRRSLYGKAGEFRFHPDKTLEYRVLSGYFSKSESLRKWVYQNLQKGINAFNNNFYINKFDGENFEDIINSFNIKQAKYWVEKYQIPLIYYGL